jgi:hypothetical protein
MKKIFEYIKADPFFKKYLPGIRGHKHKIRGKNGRGNPTDFTEEEERQIISALRKLFKDLL